ncbi:helix-turn-helix transcriptional regulator [Vreelandella neptunia]|uniref:Helix-turn-helix domain-containing protein n=1 Tax=Vreelandella neptunia TaxID=115551 RepID=A0ABZ0YQR5_9GAMM|nr:helix-turn-helix domain-containing protein [Halomonas neptunia]MDN3559127.1 helix-turn-helix domain-containing protein [Halomonas neptunia]WQH14088.1 helix-turn-helix domain-containing protein [Halomonas neptunia]
MSTTQHTHIAPAVLRYKDTAAYLGVCVNTVRNMKDAPGFPRPIRITHRSVGYRKADLDAWLESRQA